MQLCCLKKLLTKEKEELSLFVFGSLFNEALSKIWKEINVQELVLVFFHLY